MKITEWQQTVDRWIKKYGVRYFDEMTNTLLLNEEVGELSRLIARKYGEQSFKTETKPIQIEQDISDEIGDILFVVTCLANQMNIDLDYVLKQNIQKKTNRDHSRHHANPKLDETK